MGGATAQKTQVWGLTLHICPGAAESGTHPGNSRGASGSSRLYGWWRLKPQSRQRSKATRLFRPETGGCSLSQRSCWPGSQREATITKAKVVELRRQSPGGLLREPGATAGFTDPTGEGPAAQLGLRGQSAWCAPVSARGSSAREPTQPRAIRNSKSHGRDLAPHRGHPIAHLQGPTYLRWHNDTGA